jgi:general secretion pathway protein E
MMEPEPEIVLEPAIPEVQAARKMLPFSFAKRHGVLIQELGQTEGKAVYRTGASPMSIAEARRFAGVPLKMSRVSAEVFDTLLQASYGQDSTKASQMVDGLDEEFDLTQVAQELQEPSDLLESDDDAPIIRFINAVLTEAIKENASDVHIEPYENRLGVRFRVDGVLREVLQTRRALAPLVVSRIKVMSKLDIAEKRLPQDGRISLRIAGRAVDVRVSTMPSGHGERVVLRLLDKQAGRLDLLSLGMDPVTTQTVDDLIHKPHGIILVTGPTGSGKTTTLYAALERINDNTRNIMTVEDPIEYFIDGIGQSQVNTKVEMTFARGLRAVLSTLHTNTAAGAVTRLRDMGVEPFLLSSSLLGVLAQRLVRVLEDETKVPYTAREYECNLLDVDPANPPTLYHPGDVASGGFQGRTGIYELICVDDEMREMIHGGVSEQELARHARKSTPSIRADGRRQVLAGRTTLEEVLRVTRED